MMKLIELKSYLLNWVNQFIIYPNFDLNRFHGIMFERNSIIEMKMELRQDFAGLERFFNIDAPCIKKVYVPIPHKIKKIRMVGFDGLSVQLDDYVKSMQLFMNRNPNIIVSQTQDPKDYTYYYVVRDYSFKNVVLVHKINHVLNKRFVLDYKHELNLKPYMIVTLFDLPLLMKGGIYVPYRKSITGI